MLKRQRLHDAIFYGTAGVYVLILLVLLFFKARDFRSVNLVPFRFVSSYLTGTGVLSVSNVAGNILLFFPMGVYLMASGKTGVARCMAWVLAASASAEVLQYLFQVGASDIDDILLNCLGGFLGAAFGKGLLHLFRERTRRVVELLALLVGAGFLTLFLCLHFGAFGFRIRIL